MGDGIVQSAWDQLRDHLGDFVGSPGFLLSAVVLGIYVPGVIFSIVDVHVAKRMTWRECWGVYWRAMRWYAALYLGALAVFVFVPLPFSFTVPTEAPTAAEVARDLVLYFLIGDFFSYWWHRIEHQQGWYAKRIHRVHHADRPPLSIWTAMVVHPVKGFSVFLFFHLYGIVGTATGTIHLFTFAVAAFAMTAVNMITHCGYRLPGYDAVFAHAAGHDLHHANRKPTNISVVLSICDRLFGTYQPATYKSGRMTGSPPVPAPVPPT